MRTKGFCSALLRCGEIKLIAEKREWLFSVVTVIDAVSAAILPVWVDLTSLKGPPVCRG